MVDRRVITAPRRATLLVAAALLLTGPASGQGPLPPVPGPYLVTPGAGFAPQMQAPTPPLPMESAARPMFQPPANALRLPYWMQAPVTAETAVPLAATPSDRPASDRPQPPVSQQTGPAAPQGMAPVYGGPVPQWGPVPYGMQPPWFGQPMPGQPTGPMGWSYGPGPIWGPVPLQPGQGVTMGGAGQ